MFVRKPKIKYIDTKENVFCYSIPKALNVKDLEIKKCHYNILHLHFIYISIDQRQGMLIEIIWKNIGNSEHFSREKHAVLFKIPYIIIMCGNAWNYSKPSSYFIRIFS